MYDVLSGIRVLELASWTFVPTAGAVLSDWGADVIKIEPPGGGDPQRGLVNDVNRGLDFNAMFELPNRGKRSVAVDLRQPAGKEIFAKLLQRADVFTTSFLPHVRRNLGVDVADVLAVNASLIVAVGTAQGLDGPNSERGGFDISATWARGGIAGAMTGEGDPPTMPGSFGDLVGGLALAGAISAALFQRERTGRGEVVDLSLYSVGIWMMGQSVGGANFGRAMPRTVDRAAPPNPLVNCYATRDGHWLWLGGMQSTRYWGPLCQVLGAPEMASDPRFVDDAARRTHIRACVAVLDELFASFDALEIGPRLSGIGLVWDPVLTTDDVLHDEQARAAGYLACVEEGGQADDGRPVVMPTSPARFGQRSLGTVARAPEYGSDTELVLVDDLGLDWDDVAKLRDDGVLG